MHISKLLDKVRRRLRYLHEPLDSGVTTLANTARVERLLTQYVQLLRGQWAKTPWFVPWYQMRRHLAYPALHPAK